MSLYHFHVDQISRGAGQSAVASASYRAGEKLHDSYYGEEQDYTKKGGVLYTEILLPEHAPDRFLDRETLWNEVESVEKHPSAQLAYSFNIALQNELTYEENLELARRFVQENFVAKGMIVDLALHDPDKKDGGISNPHFHVLSPIRPLNPDGTWGAKQHREYILDENGERIRDEKRKFKFNAIPTTDWGKPETLLQWRKNWADLVNKKFEEKGIPDRIDHRSYMDQDLDQIPTVHEGPVVRAMEAKGICTEKGDWNRLIKATNSLISSLRKHLKELTAWISFLKKAIQEYKEDKEQSSQIPSLYSVLNDYYDRRNAGAYSNQAKVNNLKQQAKIFQFLQENKIGTLDELSDKINSMYSDFSKAQAKVKKIDTEIADINKTLDLLNKYKSNKPVFDKLCTLKKGSAASNKFKADHRTELDLFHMARRELLNKYQNTPVPKPDVLKARRAELKEQHVPLLATYKKLKEEANMAYSIKKAIEADYKKLLRISLSQKIQNERKYNCK